MSIDVHMVDGPLPAVPAGQWTGAGDVETGAVVQFEGIVRARENGRLIHALEYEVYEPMASSELRRLAENVCRTFELRAVHVEHSRGRVLVGQCAFRLHIAARHRAEALRAIEIFMDRLKQDVPIWKTPVYA